MNTTYSKQIKSVIKADTINNLMINACKELIKSGRQSVSNRNEESMGGTAYISDVDLILTNPQARHLVLEGRTNNIFASIAETFWVLSGSSAIDSYMNFFLPRAINYCDRVTVDNNGNKFGEWRGAYGPRLFIHNQLADAIKSIIKSKYTRQSVFSIWQPEFDTLTSIKKTLGDETTLDTPCTNFGWVWVENIDGEDYLNMKLAMRSNDIVYGMSGINIFEWTFIQELILAFVKYHYGSCNLGYYNHTVVNLHVYDRTKSQVEKVSYLDEEDRQEVTKDLIKFRDTPDPSSFDLISSADELGDSISNAFKSLVTSLTYIINDSASKYLTPADATELASKVIYEFSFNFPRENQSFKITDDCQLADYIRYLLYYSILKRTERQLFRDIFVDDIKSGLLTNKIVESFKKAIEHKLK